ncbi:hypothetical protein PGT21_028242 [Puccinia graminis f. sp. tritici]|uniref:Uncharacterized protein n=1 Tax=Puccinia graminis f. sp. tritici TaxID=56615 RepID=A0A5B0S495_PUCGR|nr:hypothetical protein PGT21_028242 [Puccinia graminis f. sp. tritici]KAA1132996.1 hypothetical protein PGTUg99_019816 [Puccinia graminis f. sp. tritici]
MATLVVYHNHSSKQLWISLMWLCEDVKLTGKFEEAGKAIKALFPKKKKKSTT